LLASAALLSPMEGVATAFGNSPVSLDNSNIGHHFHSIFIGKCYHYLSQAWIMTKGVKWERICTSYGHHIRHIKSLVWLLVRHT
jgi:hypothetical protein